MKAWKVGPMALAMALALGCTPQPPVEQPPEQPMVSVYEEPTPAPTPTPTPTPAVEDSYVFPYAGKLKEAYSINPDVVGWVAVPGTAIDFPIMFSLISWYYNNRDIYKEENGIGSVYSHMNIESYDYWNTRQNLVMAGSNARLSKALFHELHHVQEVNLGHGACAYDRCAAPLDPAALPDFSTEEGRIWDISICGIEGRWEIWSMYETDTEEPWQTLYYNTWFIFEDETTGELPFVPKGEADVQDWIDMQLERSQYEFGVEATTADQFLTIYTSGDYHDATQSSRLYFFLKLVEPEHEPYWAEAGSEPEGTPAPEAEAEPSPAAPEAGEPAAE